MKRHLLLASLAVAAVAAVLLWPARPTWRMAVEPGQLLRFASDGGTVFRAALGPDVGRVAVVGHDAATGAERSRVALADLPAVPSDTVHVHLAADGRRTVVTVSDPWMGTATEQAGWALFDPLTGSRVTPFHPMPSAVVMAWFSPDGRWLAVARHDDTAGETTQTLALFDAATGNPVVTFAPTATEQPTETAFRDDGTAVAVVWRPTDPTAGGSRVAVVALPSGREVRRFAGPDALPSADADFRGDRLTLVTATRDPMTSRYSLHGTTFDVAADPVGPSVDDPAWAVADLSQPHWRPGPRGPGWATRVQWRQLADRFPYSLMTWAARHQLLAYQAPDGTEERLQIIDPATGEPRGEPPTWLPGETAVSPDGQRVAAMADGSLELWPTASPWPRWPFALVAIGAVALVARRRTPRKSCQDRS